MAAALEYVDDLVPGGDLRSLEQLAGVLSAIPSQRPGRRQHPRLPAGILPGAAPAPLPEHPFSAVMKEYPWLKVITDLGGRERRGAGVIRHASCVIRYGRESLAEVRLRLEWAALGSDARSAVLDALVAASDGGCVGDGAYFDRLSMESLVVRLYAKGPIKRGS